MHLSRWRLFFACLMLVVIPLQGFAATVRSGCHALAAPVMQTQQVQQVHLHDHADTQTQTQTQLEAEALAGKHDHHGSRVGVQPHADQHAKADQCNACSPCCAGALLSRVVVVHLPDLLRPYEFFIPETRHTSPPLAGLDRPPRYQAA